MENAIKLKQRLKLPLFLTGHSFGGNLAMYNSFVTGCPTITFNPAGTSTSSYDTYKQNLTLCQMGQILLIMLCKQMS